MSNNQAIIDFSDFASTEIITRFKTVAEAQGTSPEVVLSDFMKDYIVSGGHPEQVVNHWPWSKKG